jgi:Protein of unknown function (DUF2752)
VPPPLVVARDRVLLGEVAVAAAGLAYLMAVDPHDPRAWAPFCPVKLVTGLDCPGCGGLRLAHDLVHGDLHAAVYDNLFLLLTSPLLVYQLGRHWRAVRAGEPHQVPRALAYGLAGGALAWMAVRNLPRWPLKPLARAARAVRG